MPPPLPPCQPIDAAAYQLGVRLIDCEHRDLIALLNALFAGGPGVDMPALVSRLDDYVRVHFTVEEEMMRAWAWPGLDQHRALHRAFIERLQVLRGHPLEPGEQPPAAVLSWLRRWLTEHIDRVDREVCAFMRQRGAT